jgi:hypothetical protein
MVTLCKDDNFAFLPEISASSTPEEPPHVERITILSYSSGVPDLYNAKLLLLLGGPAQGAVLVLAPHLQHRHPSRCQSLMRTKSVEEKVQEDDL